MRCVGGRPTCKATSGNAAYLAPASNDRISDPNMMGRGWEAIEATCPPARTPETSRHNLVRLRMNRRDYADLDGCVCVAPEICDSRATVLN